MKTPPTTDTKQTSTFSLNDNSCATEKNFEFFAAEANLDNIVACEIEKRDFVDFLGFAVDKVVLQIP